MNEAVFIGPVTGIDEVTAPLYLQEGEVPEMTDLVLDSPGMTGIPVRRGNWVNHPGPGTGNIDGLAGATSGGGDIFLLAFTGGSVAASKNGTGEWEVIAAGLSDEGPCGTLPVGGDKTLVFKGGSALVAGGTDFSEVTPLGIPQPVVPGGSGVTAVQHDSGGSIGAGWYNYVLVYESEQADCSMPSAPFSAYRAAATGSTGFSGNSNKVAITGLPVPDDPRVIRKRLYRTKGVVASTTSPSPFIYYELATLSPEETAYTDTKHDDELSSWKTARFTLPPATSTAWCVSKARLFAAGLELPAINFHAPPYSNDGVGMRRFTGSATVLGGELYNASDYRYRLVYVDGNGTESAFIETPVISTPGEEHENFARITLDYIPFLPSNEGTRITAKRLYRTRKDGTIFYRHPVKLTLNQTSFTDTTADSGLGEESMNIAAVITSYPATIAFSEPGRYFTFPPENLISLPGGNSDPIMSIHDDGDGVLILTRGAVHKLFTSGDPVTWRMVTLSANTGQRFKEGVLTLPGGVIFFDGGRFQTFGNNSSMASGEKVAKTLARIVDFGASAWLAGRKWCCFPVVLDDGSRLMLVYDQKTGGWYKFTHPGLRGVASLPACGSTIAGYAEEVLYSWKGGDLVKYNPEGTGTDLIGEADLEIEPCIRTREFATEGMGLQRLRKLRVYLEVLPGTVEAKLETERGEIKFEHAFSAAGAAIRIEPVPSTPGAIEFCRRVAVSLKGNGIGVMRGIKLEKRRVRS